MTLTVLQSVYRNDRPDYLDAALASLAAQTRPADAVVLVRDGALTPELDAVIDGWRGRLPLKVVGYAENRGLAFALSYGLRFAETELVARMDSDDIASPYRFEEQCDFMERNPEIALCSGFVSEFSAAPEKIVSVRMVPLAEDDIKNYLRKRNSFNHMAVCFRKSAVEAAGGYQDVPLFEDYDLWIRIVRKGFRVANLPEILVNARIGNDMIGRRHGRRYARLEMNFLRRQLRSGFITRNEFIRLVILRVPVRLLPKFALRLVYKILR